MNEIHITSKDICIGHETPQTRLEKLGAKIVSYETNERWVIDGKLVYIERAPIDWKKNMTGGRIC